MMHDFGVTATRVVFLDLPVSSTSSWPPPGRSIPYRWMPEAGARVGVMPRHGAGSDVRWIGIDPVYVFHVLNAFDDGDRVVIDVVRYDRAFDTAPGRGRSPRPARRWPAGRSTWPPTGSPSSGSTTPPSSSPASTTPWPGAPTATATAPGWRTPDQPGLTGPGQVRPGPRRVDPVRPGRAPLPRGAGVRAGGRRPGRGRGLDPHRGLRRRPRRQRPGHPRRHLLRRPTGGHRPPAGPGALRIPRIVGARPTAARPPGRHGRHRG